MEEITNNTIKMLIELNFIQEISNLLNSNSSTKKDTSILIFVALSNCKEFLNLLSNKNFIQSMLQHIDNMKQIHYVNYKEHIIATLSILRSIYIKDLSLRRMFIELNGGYLLKDFIYCGDLDIIQETIYNLEDLVCYEGGENNDQAVSFGSIEIEEMIDELKGINIEEALLTLDKKLNEKGINFENDNTLREEVKRMILIFSEK